MPRHFISPELFPSLLEARAWLEGQVDKPGAAICPCCDRHDKVYNRPITRPSIKALAGLCRETVKRGEGYYHYSHWTDMNSRGDFAKLRMLGLLERAAEDSELKKTSGMYRITELGKKFVRGELMIPSRILIYHDDCRGTGGEYRYISDFWPGFDYQEVMGN